MSNKEGLKPKELEKFLEKFDWKGFAKMFHEADIRWHEEEWKEFIGMIRSRERRRVLRSVLSNVSDETQENVEVELKKLK